MGHHLLLETKYLLSNFFNIEIKNNVICPRDGDFEVTAAYFVLEYETEQLFEKEEWKDICNKYYSV